MTEDLDAPITREEFERLARAIADTQASALVSRHLLSVLYEMSLVRNPQRDNILRSVQERLIGFYEDSAAKPELTAHLMQLADDFISNLKATLDRSGSPR